jgi:hypothetical protein
MRRLKTSRCLTLAMLATVTACHPRVTTAVDSGTSGADTDAGPADAATQSVSVGGACTADAVCVPVDPDAGAVCLEGGAFPGGYCSQPCSAYIGNDCGTTSLGLGPDAICMAFLLKDGGLPDSYCYENCKLGPDAGPACSRPGYVCGEYVAPGNIGIGPSVGFGCMASCSTSSDCGNGVGPVGVCAQATVYVDGGWVPGGVCVPACTSNAQCLPENACHTGAGDPLQGQCALADIAPPSSDAGTAVLVISRLDTPWILLATGDNLIWSQFMPISLLATAPTSPSSVDPYGTRSVLTTDDGMPPPFGGSGVSGIATDGTHLYWTDQGAVYQLGLVTLADGGLAAGDFTQLATVQSSSPVGIAIDSRNVYWATAGDGSAAGNGGVFSVPIDGGAITTYSTTETSPQGIAADGVRVFWTDFGYFVPDAGAPGSYVYPSNGSLRSLDVASGTLGTLATSQAAPVTIATDGFNVYWVNQGAYVFQPDAGYFVPPTASGEVMQVTVDGGAPIALATSQAHPYWLLAAAGQVVWLNSGGIGGVQGELYVGGGELYTTQPGVSAPMLLADGVVSPAGLTYSQGSIYFLSSSTGFANGTIWSFPLPPSSR